jgi:hypothetical protein
LDRLLPPYNVSNSIDAGEDGQAVNVTVTKRRA